jgi:hypothetical protein
MSNALEIELHQCHEYIRHVFTLYVGWFTFFLGIVLAANGWTLHASVDETGKLVAPVLYFFAVGFFEIQIVLGIIGTQTVRKGLRDADRRAVHLLKEINVLTPVSLVQPYVPHSPMPTAMHRALEVMNTALWANALLWPAAAVVIAVATYYFHIPVAGPNSG